MAEPIRDPFVTGQAPAVWDRPHAAPKARLVAVLRRVDEDAGLALIPARSRAVSEDEICAVVATDEKDAAPEATVRRVAQIGFVEFVAGGLLIEGDRVMVAAADAGEIAGFDESQMPNHRIIVLRRAEMCSGLEKGLPPGPGIVFVPP